MGVTAENSFSFDYTHAFAKAVCELVPVEIARTYFIPSFSDKLLPSTVDLSVSRSEYILSYTFAGDAKIKRSGVSSGFLNP